MTPVPSNFNPTGVNSPQPAETARPNSAKRASEVKVRHLRPLARQIILDEYLKLGDCKEVVDRMKIPGLTKDTVLNVVIQSLLPARKPVARQAVITADRRRAS